MGPGLEPLSAGPRACLASPGCRWAAWGVPGRPGASLGDLGPGPGRRQEFFCWPRSLGGSLLGWTGAVLGGLGDARLVDWMTTFHPQTGLEAPGAGLWSSLPDLGRP